LERIIIKVRVAKLVAGALSTAAGKSFRITVRFAVDSALKPRVWKTWACYRAVTSMPSRGSPTRILIRDLMEWDWTTVAWEDAAEQSSDVPVLSNSSTASI